MSSEKDTEAKEIIAEQPINPGELEGVLAENPKFFPELVQEARDPKYNYYCDQLKFCAVDLLSDSDKSLFSDKLGSNDVSENDMVEFLLEKVPREKEAELLERLYEIENSFFFVEFKEAIAKLDEAKIENFNESLIKVREENLNARARQATSEEVTLLAAQYPKQVRAILKYKDFLTHWHWVQRQNTENKFQRIIKNNCLFLKLYSNLYPLPRLSQRTKLYNEVINIVGQTHLKDYLLFIGKGGKNNSDGYKIFMRVIDNPSKKNISELFDKWPEIIRETLKYQKCFPTEADKIVKKTTVLIKSCVLKYNKRLPSRHKDGWQVLKPQKRGKIQPLSLKMPLPEQYFVSVQGVKASGTLGLESYPLSSEGQATVSILNAFINSDAYCNLMRYMEEGKMSTQGKREAVELWLESIIDYQKLKERGGGAIHTELRAEAIKILPNGAIEGLQGIFSPTDHNIKDRMFKNTTSFQMQRKLAQSLSCFGIFEGCGSTTEMLFKRCKGEIDKIAQELEPQVSNAPNQEQ